MKTVKVQVNIPDTLSLKLDWWQLEHKKRGHNISKADLIVKMLQSGSFDPLWDATIVGEVKNLQPLKYFSLNNPIADK